jgi:hypothetical protein
LTPQTQKQKLQQVQPSILYRPLATAAAATHLLLLCCQLQLLPIRSELVRSLTHIEGWHSLRQKQSKASNAKHNKNKLQY